METKLLVNSIISHAKDGDHFISADINNYFLATLMAQADYMKVQYKHISEDIRQQYNLQDKVTSENCIYIRIKKGMYVLKQAAILDYNQLKRKLLPHGYFPVVCTIGLWYHDTQQQDSASV